jgi:hypothetical protein
MILSLAVILPLRIGSTAAATDSKILLRIKKQQLDVGRGFYCSICGKKLKKFIRRRRRTTTSENPFLYH